MIIKIKNWNRLGGYAVVTDIIQYAYEYVNVRCPNNCKPGEGCSECPEVPRDISLLHQDMHYKDMLARYEDSGLDPDGNEWKSENVHSMSAVRIWAKDKHGNEHDLYAEVFATYIMNDNGKTIDHI